MAVRLLWFNASRAALILSLLSLKPRPQRHEGLLERPW